MAAEIGHGLKVDPPHHRGHPDRRLQEVADAAGVDAGHQGGHQHDPDAVTPAGFHRPTLHPGQGPSPQGQVDRVVGAIVLEEDAGKAGLSEGLDETVVLGQADAVGVELG